MKNTFLNKTLIIVKRGVLSLLAIVILTLTLTNCRGPTNLVQEMEGAYRESPRGASYAERTKDLTKFLNKQFPANSDIETVLIKLKKNKFRIRELSIDGHRTWPNGKLKKWKKHPNLQMYSENQIIYGASFSYWEAFMASRKVGMKIVTKNGLVVSVEGSVSSTSL